MTTSFATQISAIDAVLRLAENFTVPARFLIVDDHPLFLDAIRAAIGSAFPEAETASAVSIESANDALLKSDDYDLVLLDLSLPGTQGFDGLLELRHKFPKTPIAIVSAMTDPRIIHNAMKCGAAGFVSKAVRKDALADAIRAIMDGEVYLPEDYVQPADDNGNGTASDLMQRVQSLTPQQLRVLQMLRQGLLNKQIAYKLGVGETTVKAHVSEILRKLNVNSRTQAVIEVAKVDFAALTGESDEFIVPEA